MNVNLTQFQSIPTGPYDSPAEEWFLHHLAKVLAPDAPYHDHVPIDTLCGPFVIDYVVSTGARSLGFEIDGRDFHEPERDLYRDAAILATKRVDTVFRIPAADFYRYPYDALYLISRVEPAIFGERGCALLQRLAHASVLGAPISPWADLLLGSIWREEDDPDLERDGEETDELLDDDAHAGESPVSRHGRYQLMKTYGDSRRPDSQQSYLINISRHHTGGGIQSLVELIKHIGPASLDEVRTAASRLRRQRRAQWTGDAAGG